MISSFGYDCKCKACTEGWTAYTKFINNESFNRMYGGIILEWKKKGVFNQNDVNRHFVKTLNFCSVEKIMVLYSLYKLFLGFEEELKNP